MAGLHKKETISMHPEQSREYGFCAKQISLAEGRFQEMKYTENLQEQE